MTTAAPASASVGSPATSECRACTVTWLPSAAGPGGRAVAISNNSASRSCSTQCWGPGSRGASQRPIAPLPAPRSWMT